MHRLITIAVSHYNEKARWALDRFAAPYHEDRYMPLLHAGAVALATIGANNRGDRVSTRFSTPVLVTDRGDKICDSSAIVRYASDRYGQHETDLYPNHDVAVLEKHYHGTLGPDTRRVAYFYALPDTVGARKLAHDNVGKTQATLFSLALPLGKRILTKALNVTPRATMRSIERIRQEMDGASQRLAEQPFLAGDRFTAADLAFACMAAPALLVTSDEGYGAVLPPMEQAHPDAANLARELRATRAGQHALRMFAEERGPQA